MAFTPKIGKSNLALLAEQAQKEALEKIEEERKLALAKIPKKQDESWSDPATVIERLRIIFDDSGSMGNTSNPTSKLNDAKEGTVELLRNCIINQTAVAVHPLEYDSTNLTNLTTNLPALSILVKGILSGRGTPLFEIIKEAQNMEPKATRYIAFSDGSPDWDDQKNFEQIVIGKAMEDKTPIDTVLIWQSYNKEPKNDIEKKQLEDIMKSSKEYKTLQNLAEKTGGYFMVFDRNKMDFKSAFKYLAPKFRLMLASENIRKDIEEGKLS